MASKRNRVSRLLPAGLVAASLAAPTAQAQVLEEIIVTAQKRSQNLQDVPVSVSAFTGETLANMGVSQLDSMEQLTPGLSIRSIGAATIPYIRGVGADAFALGNESPNAVYLDGAYVSYTMNTTFFEFFDIDRVEVLKGPQGTLFGRNATGGAINIHTRTPDADANGKFEVSYGKYDEVQVKGYLSGPISESAGLYGSISAIVSESDGYLTNINPLTGFSDADVGEKEKDAFRIKLRWEATDDLAFTLIADHIDAQDRAALAWQPLGNEPSLVEGLASIGALPPILAPNTREPYDFSQDVQPFGETETNGLNLTIDWATSFADIKYIGSYRDFTGATSGDGDASPAPVASFFVYREIETMSHELQFSSVGDGPFRWVGGLFYFDDEAGYGDGDYPGVPGGGTSIINIGTPGPVTPAELAAAMLASPDNAALQNDSTRIAESTAIYAQGTFDFTEQTHLTLGVRFTDEEISFEDRRSDLILPNDFVNPTSFVIMNLFTGPNVSESYNETTFSVILDHEFTEDVMAYGSYKTGFKSGVYDTGTPTAGTPTEPEEIDAFEIGVKSTMLDGTMRLNGAVFFYDYSNLQVNSLDPNTNSVVTQNAAEAEIVGADLNLDWAASENLTLAFNLSLLDTEYTSFPNASVDVPTPVIGGFTASSADLSGFPLTQAPDWSANIWANYVVPLNNSGSLAFSANWYFSDSVIYNQITNFETGSYDNLNASVTWNSPSERYYVRLWGRNVTDEVVPACNAQIAFGNVCNYRPPATYGITAGVQFGG